jgi:acetyl esterase/lipase
VSCGTVGLIWNAQLKLLPLDITSAELDSLAEHGLAYSQKLSDAGVSNHVKVWKGACHAFMTLQAGSDIAEQSRQDYLRVFLKALI